jgi:phage baseplate assembly protein W
MDQLFGTDLSVVPNMVAYDAASLDLTTKVRVIRRPKPGEADTQTDLSLIEGRENIAQALLLRLLTPMGSLSTLGHPDYGSRLGELIGRRKTEELRNLCRAFVLEAVARESRVEPKAVELTFDPPAEQIDNFVLTVAVKPIRDGGDPVSLSLEVGL